MNGASLLNCSAPLPHIYLSHKWVGSRVLVSCFDRFCPIADRVDVRAHGGHEQEHGHSLGPDARWSLVNPASRAAGGYVYIYIYIIDLFCLFLSLESRKSCHFFLPSRCYRLPSILSGSFITRPIRLDVTVWYSKGRDPVYRFRSSRICFWYTEGPGGIGITEVTSAVLQSDWVKPKLKPIEWYAVMYPQKTHSARFGMAVPNGWRRDIYFA